MREELDLLPVVAVFFAGLSVTAMGTWIMRRWAGRVWAILSALAVVVALLVTLVYLLPNEGLYHAALAGGVLSSGLIGAVAISRTGRKDGDRG